MKILRKSESGTYTTPIYEFNGEQWVVCGQEIADILVDIEIGEGSTFIRNLMGEHYISLKFSLVEPLRFETGDYVWIEGERYIVTRPYAPSDNTDNGGYDYELRLDAEYMLYNNFNMLLPGTIEQTWALTDFLNIQVGQVIANIERVQPYHYYQYEESGSLSIRRCHYAVEVQNYSPHGNDPIGASQKVMTYVCGRLRVEP